MVIETQEIRNKILDTIKDYQNIFSKEDSNIGNTNIVQHSVDTGDEKPFKQKLRRLFIHHTEQLKTLIDNLL